VLVCAAFALLAGSAWARWFTIIVVAVNLIGQLGFLGASQYPLWTLVVIALDIMVLYALTARWEQAESV
jgi:predicted membrane metal-binding protein